jgi:hypothetical protein
MEVGGGPIAGVGKTQVEVDFEIVGCSLAAEEYPVIMHGACDDARGLLGARSMVGERVIEERKEFCWVLVGEKESGGGGTVFEMVEMSSQD